MQYYAPGTRIGLFEVAGRPMVGGMGVVYTACHRLPGDQTQHDQRQHCDEVV
jgi:hypothetical protein